VIVVDTSVWIDHWRDQGNLAHVRKLRAFFGVEDIVVGDLVMMELLQGAASESRATLYHSLLNQFTVLPMGGADLAYQAAGHYRFLRSHGVTVRKTIDMIIASFCIVNRYSLLHADRDFSHIARHLDLRIVALP